MAVWAKFNFIDRNGAGLLISALMLLPALLGMRLGECLRGALSPASFKRILMLSLMVLGVYMLF